MKKIALFFLCLFLTSSLWSQKFHANENLFKYGFKAGLNAPLVNDYSLVPGNWTLSGELGFFGSIGHRIGVDFGLDIHFNKL